MKDYSKIAKPLYDLLKKESEFKWTKDKDEAFDKLKTILINAPTLVLPNFSEEFLIATDGSIVGIGATLYQTRGVIAYAGRTLTSAEKNYSVSEIEMLGVVWALETFDCFIAGSKIKVITDHEPLKHIFNGKNKLKGRLMRWCLQLSTYNIELVYKPGVTNTAADCISRLETLDSGPDIRTKSTLKDLLDMPVTYENKDKTLVREVMTIYPLVGCKDEQVENNNSVGPNPPAEQCLFIDDFDIIDKQKSCPEIGKIYNFIDTEKLPENHKFTDFQMATMSQYFILDGVLMHLYQPRAKQPKPQEKFKTQIVIPVKLRKQACQFVHDFLSHASFYRAYDQLQNSYYWPKCYADLKHYIKNMQYMPISFESKKNL